MKKLIFAVTTDLSYDQRMQRICGSLARHGYQVLLIGREQPSSLPLQPRLFGQERIRCRYNKGKLFYLEFMLRLLLRLRKTSADVYCGIDLDTILPVFFTARYRNKIFVYDAHEYFPEVIEVQSRPLVKKFWLTIEQFVVPRTSHAYTVTNTIAGLFYRLYGTRFEVIRNTTVLRNLPPTPDKPEKYFIYQGAVNEGRGLEQIMEAMQQVDARLLICGKGDLFEALVARAAALGVGHKIEFLGYVLPDRLQELTSGAWAGLNLLENKGLSYYYSLANKFFDYVQAGIPQLCAGFPEYQALNAQHEVAILTDLEPARIAAAMQSLLQDQALYNRLVENCLKARLEWNWQEEEKKLISFYDAIAPVNE